VAVELFERGFRALQERNFGEAARILSPIVDAYPDEKELHERIRVYVAICQRQLGIKGDHAPRTVEERVNSATVALNRGAYQDALQLLRLVERDEAENDLVHYMMAVAHAGLGDRASALPHLQQAVELNPDNRYLAAQDSDLEPLRGEPAFVTLLESSVTSRRAGTRARTGR
jgi:tetratricopeptide (TPR) repeat protein